MNQNSKDPPESLRMPGRAGKREVTGAQHLDVERRRETVASVNNLCNSRLHSILEPFVHTVPLQHFLYLLKSISVRMTERKFWNVPLEVFLKVLEARFDVVCVTVLFDK
jgi:hypothetical protein